MTQEDKELLLKDLCARFPFGVKAKANDITVVTINGIAKRQSLTGYFYYDIITDNGNFYLKEVKPYLRPMSSMTEEEKKELINHVLEGEGAEYFHITHDGSIDGNQAAEQDLYNLNLHWLNFGPMTTSSYIDWLNKNMFDFRGLIPKDLAIEVTEENNPYKI